MKSYQEARLNKESFEDKELTHELFLRTRQTTKIRYVFASNISADIKHRKSQISKKQSTMWIFWFLVRYFRKENTNKHCYSLS